CRSPRPELRRPASSPAPRPLGNPILVLPPAPPLTLPRSLRILPPPATLPRSKVGTVRTRTRATFSRPNLRFEVVHPVVRDPRRETLKVRRRTHLLNEVILDVVRPTLHRGGNIRT